MGKGLLSTEAEERLKAVGGEDIEMKLEESDPLVASSIAFKFVAYKTPFKIDGIKGMIRIPSRMYFTLNFFTYAQTETEVVRMR